MTDRVLELLENKKYSQVKLTVADMNEVDIAGVFEEIDDPERSLRLFRLLPKEMAAEVFAYMDSDIQQKLIEALTENELRYILDDMYLDDYVDLVDEMPANVVMRVLKNSSKENRSLINQYLKYPNDSAGSLMTNEYVYFKRILTVKQAFDVIRSTGSGKETIYTCYVISQDRKLIGVVSVRDMLLADPDDTVEKIMDTNVLSAGTLDDKEEIAKMFSRYDILALPVVDNEHRLVGIITIDDAVDVMQEENTEDFEKMAGMAPSDDSYLKTSAFKLAKNRILWLMILMVSGMVTGLMLQRYEAAIAAIPLLVTFIPMLMDTGGNCGSQSSTMIIRGMALDEINMKDFGRVLFKEIRVGLLCGLALSVFNFVRIWIQYNDVQVAATVAATMMTTVCIAKSLGSVLPMLARKLKLDPAIMAAPIITTVVDACSILVFFTIAMQILGQRL
ncbi:MAG: magnesium transporter [Clostridia bacterium]